MQPNNAIYSLILLCSFLNPASVYGVRRALQLIKVINTYLSVLVTTFVSDTPASLRHNVPRTVTRTYILSHVQSQSELL